MAQLPGFEHLSRADYGRLILGHLEARCQEFAEIRRQTNQKLWTKEALRAVDPFSSPSTSPNKKRRPLFITSNPETRAAWLREYRAFCDAYRQASARYRDGERDVEFPPNCFRPVVPILKPVSRAA